LLPQYRSELRQGVKRENKDADHAQRRHTDRQRDDAGLRP
jgi:hypothetical protein